ncbi:MAG: hypothetical protein F4Y24_13280 [Gemmatimonadetes bacterium]|nr:hypothetical protein [Gemmatimonadota bacterium]MYG21630.1 hypothetical protein [Gemmatimonadota bacterium]MYJ37866.1 hypothetical protein [Gemmatimonadota bacterium]
MTSISRRSFLNSAAGATVLGLSGLAGCVYPRRDTMDVSLSPMTWGDGVVDRYFAQDDTPLLGGEAMRARHPLAIGHQGIIAGSTGNVAVHAGLLALERGGSAVDAALATALTQICLAGGSWVSYAGFLQMMYYEAATGQVHNLNAAFNTVGNETDPFTIPTDDPEDPSRPLPDGRTALVPGFMAGVEAAHQRWGVLPFETIFEPAIHFAENGFPVGQLLGSGIQRRKDVLSRLPETRAVFTRANGDFYENGDIFTQPALAATLRGCAEEGVQSHFYEGEWAERFVDTVQAEGGHMTMDDMRNYRVSWPEPLVARYSGVDVHTVGLPAYGGAHVHQALNLMDLMDVGAYGHYAESPEALFRLIQACTALRTRSFWAMESLEVPGVDLSLAARATRASATALWEAAREGRIPDALVPPVTPAGHSDCIAVVDSAGNVVGMTHTINTASWGTTGINVGGVSVPDSAKFQQQQIANVGPGVRLPDPTSPLIVTRDGVPVVSIGSIGSGLHYKTLCALTSLLDFGLDPKEAIDVGALMDSFALDVQSVGEGEFDPELIAAVEAMGQEFRVDSGAAMAGGRGYLVVVGIDPGTGRLEGAAPGEFLGGAEAY